MKLLYGTTNSQKIKHMKALLKNVNVKVLSFADIKYDPTEIVDECGNCPLENARQKAINYYKQYNIPVFSCDSGLYIEGLKADEQPGVYVRRVNGKELTDSQMINYYANLAASNGGQIKAKYKNAICLVIDDSIYFEYDGEDLESEPFILTSQAHSKRIDGFPLNSISIDPKSGKYFNEIEERSEKMKQGFEKFFNDILYYLEGFK